MAKNILVVDDEKSYVKAFVRLFTRAGYDVVTAVTGVDAMNKAHEHRPDLVILDVNMPGGGGGDVYDLLSMSSQTSDTPVFFISGTDFEDLRSDFSFIKRAQFFSKPIDEALLLERVRHLFSSGI